MGQQESRLNFPSLLQWLCSVVAGAGKTTTAAKLAALLRKQDVSPSLWQQIFISRLL